MSDVVDDAIRAIAARSAVDEGVLRAFLVAYREAEAPALPPEAVERVVAAVVAEIDATLGDARLRAAGAPTDAWALGRALMRARRRLDDAPGLYSADLLSFIDDHCVCR